MLLEALEKYSDNWNEIAEHVGTKSKAQCMLHFLRLPMEDSLLENIEVPKTAMPFDSSKAHDPGFSCLNSNGDNSGSTLHSGDQLPFANSANPVMSLVSNCCILHGFADISQMNVQYNKATVLTTDRQLNDLRIVQTKI
ncbi:SWI/SNF complex subunit SWI3C isoform X1 [Iris pallida]|uniref:SWI/SNF complex subunit SWI3C isoform X1 n=1 Tax=Iris pallida TaxID=29817 RepID=A0AAX6FZ27_IRIPA|nr:SWI/SNF complex subunit SWI3C isoform X1 [Iris pallida]